MLIYDPALDPYHSAIRILAIAQSSAERRPELSVDAARIADYFLIYPYELIGFRFPAEFRSMRAAVKKIENPYRRASGTRAAFERMRPIFFAALSGLVAANLIDAASLKRGALVLSEKAMPDDLVAAIARFLKRQTDVGKFILSDLLAMPTNGDDGLKHRSSLIEHRYDLA
jgi:hypothetical protein